MLTTFFRYMKKVFSLKKSVIQNIHFFMIGVAIVMFWRGTWWLLDQYFFPGYPLFSHIFCVVIALAIFFYDDGELDELGKL